jgi:cytochrome c553
MEARLRACEPCHGRQWEGTNNDYFPRLAGKPAGYIAVRGARARATEPRTSKTNPPIKTVP